MDVNTGLAGAAAVNHALLLQSWPPLSHPTHPSQRMPCLPPCLCACLQVGPTDHVICALSGGVDSTVAATLVHKAS